MLEAPDRPQPRLDRDTHGGMATTVGRLREEPVLENGVKLVLVSHNTKMGAAQGRGARRRADASQRFPRPVAPSPLAPEERMRSVARCALP